MRAYLFYCFSLLCLGYAVNMLIQQARNDAMRGIDDLERTAWSNGFERGANSKG